MKLAPLTLVVALAAVGISTSAEAQARLTTSPKPQMLQRRVVVAAAAAGAPPAPASEHRQAAFVANVPAGQQQQQQQQQQQLASASSHTDSGAAAVSQQASNNDGVKDLSEPDRGLDEAVGTSAQGKNISSPAQPGQQQQQQQQRPAGAPYAQGSISGDAAAFSPPFYPSPHTAGQGAWADAVAKAKSLVQRLTLEEKVNLTTGVGWQLGPKPRCVGDIAPIPRVGFPGLCLEDSPLGVRFADLVDVFPSGVSTAATFSKKLAYERGKAMGEEFKKKGVNVALGPGMNLHRAPAAGRNWEMAGADPYHAGESAHQTVRGLQDAGVQATAKHYLGNEQEIVRDYYSSNLDARTQREIYAHPFLRAVQADVASTMCSYNLVNNSWACQNSELLNRILKTEIGFQGYVMSDWGAQHSGVASALAGLDMTMPGQVKCCDPTFEGSFWGKNLTTAVNNGSVPLDRVDDMATRVLAGWYKLGQDQNYPRPNFDAHDPFYGDHVSALSQQSSKLMRQIGAAGTVLLKNTRGALPLGRPRKISIVGSTALPFFRGANFYSDRGGSQPSWIGWGSGSSEYSYLVSPYEAIAARARSFGAGVYWNGDDWLVSQSTLISDARLGVDVALVFVHANSGESYITVDGNAGDRNNLTLWDNGEAIIRNVSMVQPNTIVVVNAPGQVDMSGWYDNPNVTAILHAHMPGAEAGNAIADVLFGDYNPSGRLPYTIAKKRSDYPADVAYFTSPTTNTSQLPYTERLEVDYRHFDAKNIAPLYEFGFGLSYSNFTYSNLRVRWLSQDDWNSRAWSWPLPGWLFEDVLEVSFEVANDAARDARDGHEVPQLYLNFPASAGEPPKVLRCADRIWLASGQTKTVTYRLNRYDLSVYSAEGEGRWVRPEGKYGVQVGASSRDIRLEQKNL